MPGERIPTTVTVFNNGKVIQTTHHDTFTEAWEVYNFPVDNKQDFRALRLRMKEEGHLHLQSTAPRIAGWKEAWRSKTYHFERRDPTPEEE